MAPQVQTVLGKIAPDALGTVDMHEHVRFGMPGWETEAGNLFDRGTMLAAGAERFAEFRTAGAAPSWT